LLNDPDPNLQSAAVKALGYFKNHPETIPLIEPFLKSEHSAHREHARGSIRKIQGKPVKKEKEE
jgi:hypothetical protein